MRKSIELALLVCILFAGMAHASSYALPAIALRQVYADGDFSELACKSPANYGEMSRCSFELKYEGAHATYAFSPDPWGYHDEILSYVVHPSGPGDFALSFDVGCLAADLAQIPGATETNATCRLSLLSHGAALHPRSVQIYVRLGEKMRSTSRMLQAFPDLPVGAGAFTQRRNVLPGGAREIVVMGELHAERAACWARSKTTLFDDGATAKVLNPPADNEATVFLVAPRDCTRADLEGRFGILTEVDAVPHVPEVVRAVEARMAATDQLSRFCRPEDAMPADIMPREFRIDEVQALDPGAEWDVHLYSERRPEVLITVPVTRDRHGLHVADAQCRIGVET